MMPSGFAVAGSADVPVIEAIMCQKVYFAAFDDKKAAHYLCGLLNTSMARKWVESHTVSIQMGDVFKHMRLPEYDKGNPTHSALAS
jgi:hypothetical protein